jgi:hypothetical protein
MWDLPYLINKLNEKLINLLVFHAYFTGDFNFKGLTARRLYKYFGVKGLTVLGSYPVARLLFSNGKPTGGAVRDIYLL